MKPAREPFWEKEKKQKKQNQPVKLIFSILFLFILANLVIRLPKFINWLNNPFETLGTSSQGKQALDLSFRTNILVVTYSEDYKNLQDAALISYEPLDQKMTLLNFRFREQPALQTRAAFYFKDDGLEGLTKYFLSGLAVPIDRYIAINNPDISLDFNQINDFKKKATNPIIAFYYSVFKQSFLRETLRTDLSVKESWNLIFKLRGAKFEDKDVISWQGVIANLPAEQVDSAMENQFLDRNILEEAASITIRNSSGKTGLGEKFSKYLTNLGLTIVTVENTDSEEDQTAFFVRNSRQKAVKRISSFLKMEEKSLKEDDSFSGDLLIILGKQAIDDLTFP